MADEVEKSPQSDTEAEGSKKRSKLPLLVSARLLVAGGAAAAWYLAVLPGAADKAEHAEATAAVKEHGENGVRLRGVLDGEAALHDADEQTADDVDGGDEQAGDRSAADELTGTVHGAVEVRLRLDRAALARLFVSQPTGSALVRWLVAA